MRRRRRSCNSGWIAGALAVVALECSPAFARPDDPETTSTGPAAQEAQAPAERLPGALIFQMGAQRGVPDFKALLEEKRQSFRVLLISELHFCRGRLRLDRSNKGERIAFEYRRHGRGQAAA